MEALAAASHGLQYKLEDILWLDTLNFGALYIFCNRAFALFHEFYFTVEFGTINASLTLKCSR